MSSKRKQIRAAMVANLKAASLAAGQNVFPNRVVPTGEDLLPCVLVYTLQEPVIVLEVSQPSLLRTLNVAIEARATLNDGLDDTLDDMADAIEAVINLDPTFGGLATQTTLTDTQFDYSGQGAAPFGGARLIYEVEYLTP